MTMATGHTGYLMHTAERMAQVARDAADRALALGASDVVASAGETAGIVMRVRAGSLEQAVREGAQSVTIKVFEGGRTGTATTSALTKAAVDLAAERAIAIARTVEPDPEAAPAADGWLARGAPSPQMFAPSGLTAQDLGRMAQAVEQAALSRGSGVRSGGAGVASTDATGAIAIGRDFVRSLATSRQDAWCTAIAERDGTMTQDGWSSTDRRSCRLASAMAIGDAAVERAVRKLGGRTLPTQRCPVLFDATIASSLVNEIVGALGGRAQARGTTFLSGGLGMAALASHVDLDEDPLEPYGLASGTCDGEGVESRPRKVIDGGNVAGLFLPCLYARKLGLAPTGSADGPRNLHLTSRIGAAELGALQRQLGRGLWVTELIGGAVDPVSGTYSKAAAGFWIEGGEVAYPVQDITIAGDLPTMLRGIVAIGGDVHRSGSTRSGSVLIEQMRISGR
ncbi:TldD/PmbA family protein [Sphingomonas sp. RIT328]|uniref:TldD/PmbA family protein n=1 Tax=Sphingomonas sp. RIT328 TaxID=1470591 RepID=UPI00044A5600|nr:metallopeptidase TldD-related protein [Sphingomonas sp. RIT328]EZP50020.1 Peptidase U62, modulator of DNA gyrase [Sphingomonas sp. RIT328]